MNERKKSAAVAVHYSPNEPLYRRLWHAVNALLTLSCLFLLYTAMWQFSTRSFLRGFSDAIVPVYAAPEGKVAAILSWMEHGPARYTQAATGLSPFRDPQETLGQVHSVRFGASFGSC